MVKLSLSLINHYAMKTWGSGSIDHVFVTSALVEGECSASSPGLFTPGARATFTYWVGRWVGPRAGLDDMEKILAPIGTRTLTSRLSARSQSLYRLHYPCDDSNDINIFILLYSVWNRYMYHIYNKSCLFYGSFDCTYNWMRKTLS
jgi:hypothetical protein